MFDLVGVRIEYVVLSQAVYGVSIDAGNAFPKRSKKRLNYFENNKKDSSTLRKCLNNSYIIFGNIILELIKIANFT